MLFGGTVMADAAAQGNVRPRKRRARAAAGAPTTPDPIELAMEAEASGRGPEGMAHRLLARQARLIGWQIASERAGVALKALTAAAGLAAAAALAWAVWDASQAAGLIVEPFSVPSSLAQEGMTGQVVASRLLDRM